MGLIGMSELLNGIDILQAVAGLGLFLFAMLQLEQALEGLLGSAFKRYLRRYTQTPAGAMSAGIISTAILQSSSLVGVMSLALVGSGVIALSNGIGVILGANLGTTMTGWLVSVLGFKLDLTEMALPLLALGSLGFIALRSKPRFASAMQLILAIAMLIWALGIMKSAVQAGQDQLSAVFSNGQGWFGFFVIGVLVTLVIQSSSAMMMITLSLLAANYLDIFHAAAIIVGADLGTTGTVMLGAIGGSAPRRQVAYAHLWFNVVNAVIALLLIPFIPTVAALVGLTDPLFTLVAFHSSFNLIGILLFYPLLPRYGALLQSRVRDKVVNRALFLKPDVLKVPEAGVEALNRESRRVVALGIAQIRSLFHVSAAISDEWFGVVKDYADLKQLEFDIISFASQLESASMTPDDALCLQSDLSAVRNTIHAVKSVRDVKHSIEALYQTDDGKLHALWLELQSGYTRAMVPLFQATVTADRERSGVMKSIADAKMQFDDLHQSLHHRILALYPKIDPFLAKESELIREPALQMPSLLNMNRELFVGQRSLIQAVEALDPLEKMPEQKSPLKQ